MQRITGGGGYTRRNRDSNLELLRIIAMLFIVMHHFVVSSGITDYYDFSNITGNMLFLQLWGMWGKTAINVYVLITGYFMCTSKLTWKRFARIWLEAKFYRVIIFIILAIAGYEMVTARSILYLFYENIHRMNDTFIGSFLIFYLFIPFLNIIIDKLGKKWLEGLIAILLFIFVIASTFFFANTFNYIFWYITLYFVAAHIRLYPNKWTESKKRSGIVLLASVGLAYASVPVVDFIGSRFGFTDAYYMVSDSNKLLAFLVGVSVFCLFKNIKMGKNRFINAVASTTFGVLLIHASSAAMRQWLWQDFLHVPSLYNAPLRVLVLSAIFIPIAIFVVCSAIDYLRILFIERPLFRWFDRHENAIDKRLWAIRDFFIKKIDN